MDFLEKWWLGCWSASTRAGETGHSADPGISDERGAASPRGITVSVPAPAPTLLLATVTGQVHELGALMAGAAAATTGWSVTWLGANLPAEDIAEAARKLRARAVGLSLVHPAGDASVNEELRRLRSLLPRSTLLIAGGAASAGHAAVLEEIGAQRITTLNALVETLRDIAAKARPRRRTRALKP
jgi:methylmalonyl-CoA mutase cobalamin-binding subunit